VTTLRERWSRLVVSLRRLREPPNVVAFAVFVAILVSGVAVRLHYSAFLDPFEDGYQHWWISANLVATGEYWDRHSMMTQGSWLPLYHFFGAGVLGVAGIHNIAALKLTNIVLSTLTAILVFFVLRRHGLLLALAGTAFFSFNFIDVVVSGWSTAESLLLFLVVLGYGSLFHLRLSRNRHLAIAAAALALAVATRYEAWLVALLLVLFSFVRKGTEPSRAQVLYVLLPSFLFMAGYFLYALQWGFLPAIVVRQTSTDILFQVSVGTQRDSIEILSAWWTGYFSFFPVVLVLGTAYLAVKIRSEFGPWIVFGLWAFVVAYALLRFGNPSYRYVMLSVPFLSIGGASAGRFIIESIARRTPLLALGTPKKRAVATAATVVLIALTLIPSTATFWTPGFSSSAYMVPLQRAGEFVRTLPPPVDKILVSESPIAAYYSGYAPNQILGSRWLPDGRADTLAFLKAEAAYIVYVGVPYYKLRLLFPELQSGATTADFELLFDAGGPVSGTHAVYVFRVVS
jgi:hypothetical protein